MNGNATDKYTNFKRKVYLIVFPILFVTNASYWLFSPYKDRFMEIALPPLCIMLVIVWILIYRRRYMRASEIVSLFIFSIYHLYRVYTMTEELRIGSMDVYAFWSTTYYIFVFMVLERKKALAYSLFIFYLTIVMGLPYLYVAQANDILIQYYITTLIYLLVLYYFQIIISTFLESDLLRKYAYYDALTETGNRRLIDIWLEDEMKRCKQTTNCFSIIMFDIDHFKKVNDTFGHNIGDIVLKEFATIIKNNLTPNNLFGRWGGEEFIIIAKHKSQQEATDLAERLRLAIERHSFRYVGHLTCSFGVASFQENDLPKTIIKRADQALYRAKNNGRNLVVSL